MSRVRVEYTGESYILFLDGIAVGIADSIDSLLALVQHRAIPQEPRMLNKKGDNSRPPTYWWWCP